MKKDKILMDFFSSKQNKERYENYLKSPTIENEKKLNKLFKKHFYMVRCLSYFLKMVHYESRHFDKKQREHNRRYQLSLEKDEEYNRREIDYIPHEQTVVNDSASLWEEIENPILYKALKKLTDNQLKVLSDIYVKEMNVSEVAKTYGISQQAVTKAKKNALLKIKKEMLV